MAGRASASEHGDGVRGRAPGMTVDRVERLTNLLALLLETTQPLTLVEIAGALDGQYASKEATRRAAFERDKAALREIGVPIESVVLSGATPASAPTGSTATATSSTDLHLEPDEMRALQVAVAAIRPTAGDEALWKLGVEAADGGAAVTATVPELPALPVLREAAAGRTDRRVRVPRQGPRGSTRTGCCCATGSGTSSAATTSTTSSGRTGSTASPAPSTAEAGTTFDRPAGFDLRTAFPSDPKLLGEGDAEATVRIDGERAAGVERELGSDAGRRPARRRLDRRRGAVRQRAGVPFVGARLPRARRGARSAGRARHVVEWLRGRSSARS